MSRLCERIAGDDRSRARRQSDRLDRFAVARAPTPPKIHANRAGEPNPMPRLLTAELLIPRPIETVFAFFADAANLERLTPAFLNFHVLTPPPIAMREGTLIDYRLRLHGLPIRWRTRISAWNPPHRFIDEQLRGPYRLWIHEHSFESVKGGTLCRDTVQYAHLGTPIGERLMVRPSLDRIFAFRQQALLAHFG